MDKRRSEVDVKDGVEEDGMHHHPCHNHLPHLHLADSNAALTASSDVQTQSCHNRILLRSLILFTIAVSIMLFYFALLLSQPHLSNVHRAVSACLILH